MQNIDYSKHQHIVITMKTVGKVAWNSVGRGQAAPFKGELDF